MKEDSATNDYQLTSNMLNLVNIAIVAILAAAVIFERFSITTAIISSLVIWIIFGGFFTDLKRKWQEKRDLIDQGKLLHQFCPSCDLRFSINSNQCPRCDLVTTK